MHKSETEWYLVHLDRRGRVDVAMRCCNMTESEQREEIKAYALARRPLRRLLLSEVTIGKKPKYPNTVGSWTDKLANNRLPEVNTVLLCIAAAAIIACAIAAVILKGVG